jgi:hypothetical protein
VICLIVRRYCTALTVVKVKVNFIEVSTHSSVYYNKANEGTTNSIKSKLGDNVHAISITVPLISVAEVWIV